MNRTRSILFALALLVGGLLVSADAQVSIQRGWSMVFASNGTAGAPSITFGGDTDTGLFWAGSNTIGLVVGGSNHTRFGSSGELNTIGPLGLGSATAPDVLVARVASGVATIGNSSTQGVRLQFNAAPTISSGFGTSPSITTGSTDTAGSVNVGTGGTATQGVVLFNATWSAAPFCTATNATTTAGNTRALGASASTTQLTITAATAWAASTVVNWTCIGAK